MEIPVLCSDRPTVQDSLSVVQKLGEGKFSVYHVFSSSHVANYSLKVFPKTEYGASQYKNEKIISKLDHPNIIKYIPIKCQTSKFHGLVTELAKYGDFFDLVNDIGLSSEILVRTYFHQLINGLEYLHSQGIAHLDLKLENIMLGPGKALKIIDFDQAQPIANQRMVSGGTAGYRAPEVINGTCRNLAAADVFSAGIILYAFMTSEFPFAEMEEADPKDTRCYLSMVRNNKVFWETKAQLKGDENFFSQDFIELVNGMLNYNPARRLRLKEIKESKWYNGPVLDTKSLRSQNEGTPQNLRGDFPF